MDKHNKIFVAGHQGLVGSAIVRALMGSGFKNLVTRSRHEVDLRDKKGVESFFSAVRPDYVVLAAARVGGILANSTFPADFIRENLLIQTHVIDAAYRNGTKQLLFLGSSCIYPRAAPQPLQESDLLTSRLEPTNKAYAIAKIAGIEMCQAYRSQYGFDALCVMPTNLYGPNDNFDLQDSHVLPALVRKFHEATLAGCDSVEIWGSGDPRREFLHVDDLADACLFLMRQPSKRVFDASFQGIINIGVGEDLSILELAKIIRDVVGFRGRLRFDPDMPDGTPRKLLDVSRINALGWYAKISLRTGIERTYDWYKHHHLADISNH